MKLVLKRQTSRIHRELEKMKWPSMCQKWENWWNSNEIFFVSFEIFQRNKNPRLSNVMQDLDFDDVPTRRNQRFNDEDEEDDLCAMMDRLPESKAKQRRWNDWIQINWWTVHSRCWTTMIRIFSISIFRHERVHLLFWCCPYSSNRPKQ